MRSEAEGEEALKLKRVIGWKLENMKLSVLGRRGLTLIIPAYADKSMILFLKRVAGFWMPKRTKLRRRFPCVTMARELPQRGKGKR